MVWCRSGRRQGGSSFGRGGSHKSSAQEGEGRVNRLGCGEVPDDPEVRKPADTDGPVQAGDEVSTCRGSEALRWRVRSWGE